MSVAMSLQTSVSSEVVVSWILQSSMVGNAPHGKSLHGQL